MTAKNGRQVPVVSISETMEEEERRLQEERSKQEEEEALAIAVEQQPMQLGQSSFKTLEQLLSKAQMYSQFLMEKMEEPTEVSASTLLGTPTLTGNKRKANGGRNGVKKKSKNENADVSSDRADASEEEEILKRKQLELSPLLTGGTLKVYQIKGVQWMISLFQNGLNGILADQMGLGKTVQTIAFLAHLRSRDMHGPYLIVAPLSTLSNWVNEFKKWVPAISVLLYHGSSKEERAELRRKYMPVSSTYASFPVIVTSYEIAINDRRFLQRHKWKYVIVDEGHRLKNLDCKLIKELKQLKTENTLLLTGTPLQNNLAELWSLLNFILPHVFSSLQQFQSWFDISGRQTNGAKPEEMNEKRNVEIVQKLHLILKPFLLRRLKEDVEKSLPRKKEVVLYANMSNNQKEFHDHLINKTLVEYFEATRTCPGAPFKKQLNCVLMQLRKNCNHPDLLLSDYDKNEDYPPVETMLDQCGKLRLLDRLLKHLKDRGHKILIFSQMTRMLDIIEYYLSEQGLEPCRIDGSVQLSERQRQIQEFNDPKSNIFIFLLSTRAGGLGINLTSADTVVIYDSDWNPHMDLQAMDRCHRIGQTRPVHVYRLATALSVECKMLKVANSKLKLEHLVIEKGHFKQEKELPKTTLQESDLLAILKPERDQEEELVQSAEISEENLLVLLDRSDMDLGDLEKRSDVKTLPVRGPGWEVVSQGGASINMLSAIEGYRKVSTMQEE